MSSLVRENRSTALKGTLCVLSVAMYLCSAVAPANADDKGIVRNRAGQAAQTCPASTQQSSEKIQKLETLANQGDRCAQFSLGDAYYNGDGVSKDWDKAADWYLKAARQGHPEALFKLGWMYENGRGVVKDPQQAIEWYRQAEAKGHKDARDSLNWLVKPSPVPRSTVVERPGNLTPKTFIK